MNSGRKGYIEIFRGGLIMAMIGNNLHRLFIFRLYIYCERE